MVNFMGQLDWPWGARIAHCLWGVSVRVFREEISI